MKRSEINNLVKSARKCFEQHGWALPKDPRWDVTDFGLGDWRRHGLVLVNLAEEPEYCEKLMYAQRGMMTPAHTHLNKKEDIICRWGGLLVTVFSSNGLSAEGSCKVKVNGALLEVPSKTVVVLEPGERITLWPGTFHEFQPATDEVIIGEVSTANDDLNDNIFANPDVGRFSSIDEDEGPLVRLVSD
ncbi:MAG: D-lyxose/D-mannose family sugar isomerase [Armatimonadetes bacterium]|nr:D-lyxose/D-mannose family sugar isomerase [Armatimonadota bacterium]